MEVEAYPRGLFDLEKGNRGEIWGESVWGQMANIDVNLVGGFDVLGGRCGYKLV